MPHILNLREADARLREAVRARLELAERTMERVLTVEEARKAQQIVQDSGRQRT
jgi:ribosomal protein S2